MTTTRKAPTNVQPPGDRASKSSGPAALREVFSNFPQAVVLIAAEVAGQPEGLIASTFTVGISLDPPLVAVAIQHTSSTWPRLSAAPRLGITLIGDAHAPLTRQLAGADRHHRFDGVDLHRDADGALTLPGAPAWMTTRIHDQIRAGDHDLILLEVLDLGTAPGVAPVIFHRSSFRKLAAPGNPA